MLRTIVFVLLVVALSFAIVGCVDDSSAQKTISDQAIVNNDFSEAFDFFFTDVVCADPTNTMATCH